MHIRALSCYRLFVPLLLALLNSSAHAQQTQDQPLPTATTPASTAPSLEGDWVATLTVRTLVAEFTGATTSASDRGTEHRIHLTTDPKLSGIEFKEEKDRNDVQKYVEKEGYLPFSGIGRFRHVNMGDQQMWWLVLAKGNDLRIVAQDFTRCDGTLDEGNKSFKAHCTRSFVGITEKSTLVAHRADEPSEVDK